MESDFVVPLNSLAQIACNEALSGTGAGSKPVTIDIDPKLYDTPWDINLYHRIAKQSLKAIRRRLKKKQ